MKTLKQILESYNDDVLDHSKSVSYTHPENKYTVTIVPRKPGKYIMHGEHDQHTPEIQKMSEDDGYPARHGQTFITHPNGEKVKSGFWMNQPEKGWKHDGVDLYKDWKRTLRMGKSHFEKLPLKTRLEMEVKQQAHAYDPLPEQFAYRKGLKR